MNKLLNIALCDIEQKTGGDSITYNDGQGVKDTIVMTGPLSSIYTKALNIFFSKKELSIPNDNVEKPNTDSVSVATESAAIQTMMDHQLMSMDTGVDDDNDEENTNNNLEIFNSVKFVDAGTDLIDPPKAIIYAGAAGKNTSTDELEIIQAEFDRYADSDKDWVLFIGPYGYNNDNQLEMQVAKATNEVNAFNAGDSFKRATEEFYAARGIPVVVGVENLAEWLVKRSK